MEGKFELQFENNEYYLVDGNTNDTVATTDKVLLKEYDGYMKKLSLKNCEAIENGYDLDELAYEYDLDAIENVYGQVKAFKAGFQKALEILGDKKFSEEDVKNVYLNSFKHEWFGDCIKSLQQTEWDVEIEMEKEVGTKLHDDGREFFWTDGTKPKLDSDGCLILRRC